MDRVQLVVVSNSGTAVACFGPDNCPLEKDLLFSRYSGAFILFFL